MPPRTSPIESELTELLTNPFEPPFRAQFHSVCIAVAAVSLARPRTFNGEVYQHFTVYAFPLLLECADHPGVTSMFGAQAVSQALDEHACKAQLRSSLSGRITFCREVHADLLPTQLNNDDELEPDEPEFIELMAPLLKHERRRWRSYVALLTNLTVKPPPQ